MKKNIIANFIGRFWGVLSNFLFIPLYISLLGIESYSVISFALVIQGIMAIMDAGLTATLSREFASSKNSIEQKLKIFRTLESCYYLVSLVAIILIVSLSNIIANNWLNLELVSPESVSTYLKWIGVGVGFQLLGRFYSGGFIGLEKQVKSNIYEVVFGIVRNGLVLIPIYYNPTLELFFIWQTVSTIIYVIIIRIDLKHTLYGNISSYFKKPKIDKKILKHVWKFAGGMMLISLIAGLNSQMDKLALSNLLPIETLGIYTLAFSLSNGLHFMSRPISTAILPRMTALFTSNNKEEAVKLFSKSYILVSILVFSFAASLYVYGEELVWAWTNNKFLALKASEYIPWIASGIAFLTLQNLPFNVVVSNGYTRYNNILGIASLIITMPGYWIFTKLYGGVGAAATFAFVQIIITIVFLFLVNKRFMQLSLHKLYFKNFITPLIISLSITFVMHYFFKNDLSNRWISLLKIGLTVICSLSVNVIVLFPINELKQELVNIKSKYKKRF